MPECIDCGTTIHRVSKARALKGYGKRCSPCAHPTRAPRTCPTCGVTFKKAGHAQQMYCSQACTKYRRRSRPYDGRLIESSVRYKLWVKQCAQCSAWFVTKKAPTRFCSKTCNSLSFYVPIAKRRDVRTLICKDCCQPFNTHRSGDVLYCGKVCVRRSTKRNRQRRLKGRRIEVVRRADICRRDGGCASYAVRLCGTMFSHHIRNR